METAYSYLWIGCMIVLAICIFFCLIRSIKGPSMADRIIAVNMIGTMIMTMIAILSLYLKESFLLDVAIVYAAVSFLAVVVLTKVYTGVFRERKEKENGDR